MVATLAHAELTCKCLAPTDLVNAAETDSPTESVSHSPPETDATPADATRTERQLALRTSVLAWRMAALIPLASPFRGIVTLARAAKQEPLLARRWPVGANTKGEWLPLVRS